MSAEALIRRARREDIEAILELWAAERSGHAVSEDCAEDLERMVDGSPSALFVAESGGRVIGALVAAWDGWRGNMYRLAVLEEHRRRGVARRLVDAGEDYLSSCGARRVTALVARDDGAAGAFWDAAGYPLEAAMGRRVRNI